jgi:hypothetical protein
MNWKRRRLAPVERENDQLRTTVALLRTELTHKQGYAAKLELVCPSTNQPTPNSRGRYLSSLMLAPFGSYDYISFRFEERIGW